MVHTDHEVIIIGNEELGKCAFYPDGTDGLRFNVIRECPNGFYQATQRMFFGFRYERLK